MKATLFFFVCSIFVLAAQGQEECSPICTMIMDPVCIERNGKVESFSSPCGLNYFLCKNSELKENVDYKKTSCPEGQQILRPVPVLNDPCNKACPKIMKPVCIRKMDTNQIEKFDNSCLLGIHVCKNGLRRIVEYVRVACPEVVEEA